MTVPVRLRFDKVVVRLMADLQAALAADVPAGTTVLVSCTAPIRVPGQTAAAIVARARTLLARAPARRSRARSITIHGNEVGVRVVTHAWPRAPRTLGFVHNPGPRPEDLLDVAAGWFAVLGGASARRKRASDDLVLSVDARSSPATAALDRHVCSQLLPATPFQTIVLVDAAGRDRGDERRR